MVLALLGCGEVLAVQAQEHKGQRQKNPQAVAEILAGARKVANAAWWGFDEKDSTRFLQAAINSGAKKVVVSNMGRDWVITPIALASDQEIFFEPGVVVTAKKGQFHGTHDSLFKARDKENISIGGYGATLRMQKPDYMSKEYKKAQWRTGIYLDSCSNVNIYGLTIRDTGGDGVYLGDAGRGYSDNVTIKDIIFDNNYRQGISVISVENLVIENCLFKDTSGTGPAAGIDLEPDGPKARLINVVIRNCIAENNQGPGFVVSVGKLDSKSKDVSILFENCYVKSSARMEGPAIPRGLEVSGPKDDGPKAHIEFRNCHVENTQTYGALILDMSSANANIRFLNCTWKNVANGQLPEKWWQERTRNVPIMLWLRGKVWSTKPGGVQFIDCVVRDDQDRPFIIYWGQGEDAPALHEVKGNFTAKNPNGVRVDLGSDLSGVKLRINE